MAMILRSNWWALVLRGCAAILLAIVTFAVPGATIAVLTTIFGIYALVDGVLAIVSTIRAIEGHKRWGALLTEGIVGIVVGLYAITQPIAAAAILVYVLAGWALVTGALEILAAIRLRRHIQGEWLLGALGLISIIFAISLFAAPISGAVVLVSFLAAYGLLFGILLIVLGLRLRRLPARAVSVA